MDKDLKALRIDPARKRSSPSSSKAWFLALLAFFTGSLLTLAVFRLFLTGGDSSPVRADAAAASEGPANSTRDLPGPPAPDPEEPVLIASGYIVPHHRIEVGSKILGKVAWVGVEKSDKVEKGQLLVKLEDYEFRTQLAQSEAALDVAKSRLAELEAGSRPEEIERARAEVNRSRADLRNAELEYERLRSLLELEVISQQEVDNASTRLDMASAALAVNEKNLKLVLEGPRVEQIQQARAEVARTRAAVEYWKSQIKETEIRSPIRGTVLERRAEVGEMVSTSFAGGATVVALADLNDLQVELDISQSEFHNISPDSRCRMAPIAYKDRVYECEIAEIAPEANRQRATIQVKVQILEPDAYLRPEMDAQVTFYRGNSEP